ncbi:hypothetical protein [Nonomuraea sp. B19D2]|uniref:hypothetical protein n=1 Tax=Nonomuraea sp. B19D2 TaxID=3159561 RepID=UPI0032DB8067
MSVVPAPSAGWSDSALRVTAVMLSWLAAVLATALLCQPTHGTKVLAPVVVAVTVAVVILFGRPVSGALALYSAMVFAMTVWGEVGGAVLVASTITALVLFPLHAVQPGPGGR